MNNILEDKIGLAKTAQEKWQKTSFETRSNLLKKVAGQIEKDKTDIAKAITNEVKKSINEALLDCGFAIESLRFFAQEAPEYLIDEKVPDDEKRKTLLAFEPVGVIGAIKPWNFPFDLPIWSCIAPAIMAGNSVILKPSPIAPKSGEWIGKLFTEAGASNGLVQILVGDDEAGKELVQSDVDMISFTGSVEVGKEIAIECARSGKYYNLEMGGKDVAIVLGDCDISKTTEGIVLHGFMNNGQVCTGIERVLIHSSIYKEFIQNLSRKIKDIPSVPFASGAQFNIVKNQLQDAANKCKIIVGGEIVDENKLLLEPTLIKCTDNTLKIWKNETFGPVLAVRSFKNLDEAIETANNTNCGLGASVWTQDKENFLKIARELEVGMVWQNDANLPILEGIWTGWKNSGFGYSLGKYGTRAYTKIKQISSSI